jgi:hypothetical protein
MTIFGFLNRGLNMLGCKAVPKGLGYFSARDIVKEARQNNLTLCEYLEQNDIGGVGKRRDLIITALRHFVVRKRPSDQPSKGV